MADTKIYQNGTKKFLTGISITHEEKDIVNELKEQRGTGSFSLALGMIIREWAEMRKQYITVPVGGVIKDGIIQMAPVESEPRNSLGETVEEEIEARRRLD